MLPFWPPLIQPVWRRTCSTSSGAKQTHLRERHSGGWGLGRSCAAALQETPWNVWDDRIVVDWGGLGLEKCGKMGESMDVQIWVEEIWKVLETTHKDSHFHLFFFDSAIHCCLSLTVMLLWHEQYFCQTPAMSLRWRASSNTSVRRRSMGVHAMSSKDAFVVSVVRSGDFCRHWCDRRGFS